MTDLVTGASGFLGSHLAEALVTGGRRVRALVRSQSPRSHLDEAGIECAEGALEDVGSLRGALSGVERVFHCAALAADWGPREAFRAANVRGLENILEVALQSGVERFVHVSTTDVYGYPNRPVDETFPFRRRGFPYGDTKIEAEERLWEFAARTGLPVSVVRPANIYGPGSESFVLEPLRLLRAGQLALVGPPDQPAGLGYVTNVADALLLAGSSPAALGEAFNVHDGTGLTWRAYLGVLAELAGLRAPRLRIPRRLAYGAAALIEAAYGLGRSRARPPLTRMVVEVLGTHQDCSTEKIRRLLGFEPRVGFAEGMRRVGEWLEAVEADGTTVRSTAAPRARSASARRGLGLR
jgi:nucleoside-diphosphate-sugar epimerase